MLKTEPALPDLIRETIYHLNVVHHHLEQYPGALDRVLSVYFENFPPKTTREEILRVVRLS